MGWTTDDIPDLNGKVAVVTGATSGLGYESVRALASAGAHVIMAARNQGRAQEAHDAILADYGQASLEIVELDLASLDSVRNAVAAITSANRGIDILINNAGIMAMPQRQTADGFEMQFGVNHLGHWVLTSGLLRPLCVAESARVVTVTSTAHHFGRAVDPADPNLAKGYGPWRAYLQAKLANYHFGIGLQQEFANRGLAAASLIAHPGVSDTNLMANSIAEGGLGRLAVFWKWLPEKTGMAPARGALPQLRAATDPNAKGGEFYAPRFGSNGVPVRRPILRRIGLQKAIGTLWSVSESMTGTELDFSFLDDV